MSVTEYALADIVRVEIVTEEAVPVTHRLTDVSNEASIEANVSEGEENILRIRNTIKALNKTEDIVTGFNITLKTVVMIPEVLALVDGGNWDGTGKKYTAPAIGSAVSRKAFTTKIYTAQKDANGNIDGYVEFAFKNCKGKPVSYTLTNGEFYAQEMVAESRPASGTSPIEISHIASLPA